MKDLKLYRPSKISSLAQRAFRELQKHRKTYTGWKRDFTEMAILSHLNATLQEVDENNEKLETLLKEIEEREKFLNKRFFFLSEE